MCKAEIKEMRKMNEDETKRMFIDKYKTFQVRSIVSSWITNEDIQGNSDKTKTSQVLGKAVNQNKPKPYEGYINYYLQPLLNSENLDYFIIMFDIFVNRIIRIQFNSLRERYDIDEWFFVKESKMSVALATQSYNEFVQNYSESCSRAKKELKLFLKSVKELSGKTIIEIPGFYEILKILTDTSLKSAFTVGDKLERQKLKATDIEELYSDKIVNSEKKKKAREFIINYNILLPRLYVFIYKINRLSHDLNKADFLNPFKSIPEKLSIYRIACILPPIYQDILGYAKNEKIDFDGLTPSFRNVHDFSEIMENWNTALEYQNYIKVFSMTELPFRRIEIEDDLKNIINNCKIASPKVALLIDKYKKIKNITRNSEIFNTVHMPSTSFYAVYNKGREPERPNILLLILGLKLTYDEAVEFVSATKYGLEEKITKKKERDLFKFQAIIKAVIEETKDRELSMENYESIMETVSSKNIMNNVTVESIINDLKEKLG